MDIAAGIVASRRADGPVATVAIDAMEFLAPIHLRDLISVYAEVEQVGRTSMKVRIEVIATRDRGATEVKVTEGLFTFVALDDEAPPAAGRARPSQRSIAVAQRRGCRWPGRCTAHSSQPSRLTELGSALIASRLERRARSRTDCGCGPVVGQGQLDTRRRSFARSAPGRARTPVAVAELDLDLLADRVVVDAAFAEQDRPAARASPNKASSAGRQRQAEPFGGAVAGDQHARRAAGRSRRRAASRRR